MVTIKEELEEGSPSPTRTVSHTGDEILLRLAAADEREVLVVPVYGVRGSHSAVCTLLRIEGILCLLDCGWTEKCDVALLQPLAAIAPRIDVHEMALLASITANRTAEAQVLLSHADVAHVGALPYLVAHMGLTAKVYATLPVRQLGLLCLYELLSSLQDAVPDFDIFTFDDVDAAFEQIEGVRYLQQVVRMGDDGCLAETVEAATGPRRATVRFAAHPAGHSLGGAMWHVSVQHQDFLYAVSFALKNDSHLKGCSAQAIFHRPALLITDAKAAGHSDPPREQPAAFASAVVDALRMRDGHVVIPVDAAGRVLELLVVLDAHWRRHALTYPIVLLAKTGFSMLAKARAQLEFLSDKVQKDFSRGRDGNPLELRHVTALATVEALHTLPRRNNIVVLAPLPTLDAGLCRELLFVYRWALDERNTIILPLGAGAPDTLAGRLARHAASRSAAPLDVDLDVAFRVPLTPEEEAEQRRAAEAAARAALAGTGADDGERAGAVAHVGPDAGDASTGGGVGGADAVDGLATGRSHTATIAQRGTGGGETHAAGADAAAAAAAAQMLAPAFHGVLIDGFVPPRDAVAPMFPSVEPGPSMDAYGAVGVDLVAEFGRTHYDDDDELPDGVPGGDQDGEGDVLLPYLEQRPTKVVVERRSFRVAAALRVFDFTSVISDSAFHSFARAVAPRNLVLLCRPDASPASEALFNSGLDDYLRGLYVRVHTPEAREVLPLPSTACVVASLAPALVRSLEASEASAPQIGPYRFDWLDAVVSGHDKRTGNPIFDEPPSSAADKHSGAAVFFGGMMVSDVTRRLKESGVEVEQEGECAVVEGSKVLVRQDASAGPNELIIEGALGAQYYQVRDAVYARYRLVK